MQNRKNLIDLRIGHQLIGIAIAYFIGMILTMVFSMIAIGVVGKNISLASLSDLDFADARNRNLLLTLLPIQTFFLFGLPAMLFGSACFKPTKEFLGFKTTPTLLQTLLSIVAMLSGLYFAAQVAEWNMKIPMPSSWKEAEQSTNEMTKSLMTMTSFREFAYMLFTIGILPAVCEELFFRGCIQNILTHHFGRKNIIVAVLITAVIFALMHGQMQTALARVVLGIVLGLVYFYTNSIWASIFIHFLNNGLQVFLSYIAMGNKTVEDFTNNTSVNTPIALICAAVSCIALLILFKIKVPFTLFKNTQPLD